MYERFLDWVEELDLVVSHSFRLKALFLVVLIVNIGLLVASYYFNTLEASPIASALSTSADFLIIGLLCVLNIKALFAGYVIYQKDKKRIYHL